MNAISRRAFAAAYSPISSQDVLFVGGNVTSTTTLITLSAMDKYITQGSGSFDARRNLATVLSTVRAGAEPESETLAAAEMALLRIRSDQVSPQTWADELAADLGTLKD